MKRLIVALSLLMFSPHLPARAGLVESIAAIKPSVVGITLLRTSGPPTIPALAGTGFVVADGRHVVTNLHVVNPPNAPTPAIFVYARGASGLDRRTGSIVARDPAHDLALIRIDGAPLPAVRLAGTAAVPEGSSIAITGYPMGPVFGLIPASNQGIISAVTPNIGAMPHSSMLNARMIRSSPFFLYQLDMIAFPGNSGSPLYLADSGEVIGVVAAGVLKKEREQMLSQPTSISFAVPVSKIRELLMQAGLLN